MKKGLFIGIACFIMGVIMMFGLKDCRRPVPKPITTIIENVAAEQKVRELTVKLAKQDSLIKHSKVEIYETIKTVNKYIYIWKQQHDTLTVSQVDTLIITCDSLAIQSERNDSLHQQKETTMGNIIVIQKSEIDTCSSGYSNLALQNAKLQKKVKNNRKIAFVEGSFIVLENTLLYLLHKP